MIETFVRFVTSIIIWLMLSGVMGWFNRILG